MTPEDAARLALRVTRCPSHRGGAYMALLDLDASAERDAVRWVQRCINNATRKGYRDEGRRRRREAEYALIRSRIGVRCGVEALESLDEARSIIAEASEDGAKILRTMVLHGCNKNQAGRLHGLPPHAIPNHMRATRRRLAAAKEKQ